MEDKKIALGKLIKIRKVFSPHYEEKISVKLAFKIYRFCAEAEKEEVFYNERWQKIIGEYGEKDENGKLKTNEQGFVPIIPEKKSEFETAVSELDDTEVDLPDVTFSKDELSEISISVLDAAAISDIVTG